MKANLILSARGQITLPAAMRKRLGLTDDAILTAEEIGGRIVLTPAIVVETERYSDEQIAAWNQADRLSDVTRKTLQRKLGKR